MKGYEKLPKPLSDDLKVIIEAGHLEDFIDEIKNKVCPSDYGLLDMDCHVDSCEVCLTVALLSEYKHKSINNCKRKLKRKSRKFLPKC